MQDWVYVHEDDWGRYSLEAREVRENTSTAAAVRDFAVQRLTRAALREVLGDGVVPLGGVRCGCGNATEPLINGFAFACARIDGDPSDDWNVLYGLAKDEKIVQLHLTFGTPAIANLLHRLGTTFGLILLSGHDVVDLAVRTEIDHFLTHAP